VYVWDFRVAQGISRTCAAYDVFFHKGVASISDSGEQTMKPLGGCVALPFE